MAYISQTGNVAHDAVDSGNPVKVGGKAESNNPADVADADRPQIKDLQLAEARQRR